MGARSWIALGLFVVAGCSIVVDTNGLSGGLESPPFPKVAGDPSVRDGGNVGVTDGGDAGVTVRPPFCASRDASANVLCEDFDEQDGGNDFFGWTRQLTNNGTVEYSTAAYSAPYSLHSTIPSGATYAQAYLVRYGDLPRSKRYRVTFMVRGSQPKGDDALYFSHVFFDSPAPKRYIATMLLTGPDARPFRAYLSESTQGYAPDREADHQTTAPSFANAWTPVELTFDFGASPAKATFKVGTSQVEFEPLVSDTIDTPDVRLGLEAYDVKGTLDGPADFFYDDFLFEALP